MAPSKTASKTKSRTPRAPRKRASRLERVLASRASSSAAPKVPVVYDSPYAYTVANPAVPPFTFDSIMAATLDENTAVRFLMDHDLLASSKLCEYCDKQMNFEHPDKQRSPKKGTFFDGAKLPYRTVLRLMLLWASDIPVGTAEQFLCISDVTTIAWYGYSRDICSAEILQCTMAIEGLKQKSKYGRGRQHEYYWLFGGVGRKTGRWFGIMTGANRKKKTLSPLIGKHIAAGSTIISDPFYSYVSVNGKHTLENNKWRKGKNYT
ncbi:hypothetical protein PR003_g23480 [Phytophthora rubi]|uniref:ISXO2-like transposase domain-containing protein n=1 Tax=Phytophthora rubi TaxID=129364 RepID=A0A6A3J8Z2_9STRA|nr:hypothetical protein PR001_g22169 [Phytophthora rubi]KAE9000894.1 hypothetical protein PR002_g18059 [Phytophthora rubi]KAE9297502.1 hypothetical protein PR003_g23480 [Phytophthora rubi]